MKLSKVTRPALAFVRTLTDKVVGFASSWTNKVMYKILAVFPIPSESKWRGSVELSSLLLQTVIKLDENNAYSESASNNGQHLEWLGEHWMWRRAEWLGFQGPYAPAINTTLVTMFKTLDMPTKVSISGQLITTVTTRCPFLEKARVTGKAEATCEAVCAEKHSLFMGVVKGLPFHVRYYAPYMMGYRDHACVKVFKLIKTPVEDTHSYDQETKESKQEAEPVINY